jgi:hypothetical protein
MTEEETNKIIYRCQQLHTFWCWLRYIFQSNSSSKKLSLACAARRLNQPKKNPLYKEERVIEKQTNKFLKTKLKKEKKRKEEEAMTR